MRLLYILLILACFPGVAMASETLTVAVASSVLAPAKKLATQFEEARHIRVKLVSGSTGMLYSQIMHGAPYALFMAADDAVTDVLLRQRELPATSVATYALGRLYFCVQQGLPDMKRISGRIAMADPRLAPYGRAAAEALRASGIWADVQPHVIYTPNVMLAASHFQHGFVDGAFVASSGVSQPTDGRCMAVDASLYVPIRHRAVMLKRTASAWAWLSFIHSHQGQLVWQRAGFMTEAD